MKATQRKVNKPRLTLRKQKKTPLGSLNKSIVNFIFGAVYDIHLTRANVSLEDMLGIFLRYFSDKGHEKLSGVALQQLRSFISSNNLEDWTDGSKACDRVVAAPRRRADKR